MLERQGRVHCIRAQRQFIFILLLSFFVASNRAELNMPQYPPQEGYSVVDAFPSLRFEHPVAMRTPPGETNRLFVVERTGRILVITNLAQPTISVFLDLTDVTSSGYHETGLLGLAFHPGFSSNRQFFVYRTAHLYPPGMRGGFYNYIARFEASDSDPNRALRDSETPIFRQFDGEAHHNAGDLHFGLDGYLYAALGDDGPAGSDISTNYQPIDKGAFGVVLRIDVDRRPENLLPNPHESVTENYLVPNDNPFVGITHYQGLAVEPNKVRTEIFANGFRNPWRMAFHPETGALIVGDVGNGLMEELNLVVKGGNYGWPYYEGEIVHEALAQAPEAMETVRPIVSYGHGNKTNEGNCVIAGVFYFGSKIPQLRGQFIYGDFRRGHIWALENDGVVFNSQPQRLTGLPDISTFGLDPRDGEVLVASIVAGKIMKLVYTDPASAAPFPKDIQDTGAFANLAALDPVADLIPFEVNHSFWSDGALKRRWFAPVSTGEKIRFETNGNGIFPSGSVWVKHFDLELTVGDPSSRRRLETRFLVKTNDGFYGVTYRWDASGTTARLVDQAGEDEELVIREAGIARTQIWHYPSQLECRICHTDSGGGALGFSIPQLNKSIHNGSNSENQLEAFRRAGYIDLPETNYARLPSMAGLNDESKPINLRARSFLAANCSSCHSGPNLNAAWDATFTSSFAALNVANILDTENIGGIVHRLATTSIPRMPPIGRSEVDTKAIELLNRWISALPKPPWTASDIGSGNREGSSSMESARAVVSGSGVGFGPGIDDQLHFLSLMASNNLTAVARLVEQNGVDTNGAAGLMFRGGPDAKAAFAFVGRDTAGSVIVASRKNIAHDVEIQRFAFNLNAQWLRLEKAGPEIVLSISSDGVDWVRLDVRDVNLGSTFSAGFSSFGGDSQIVNDASFADFSFISIDLVQPADTEIFAAGENIRLQASTYFVPGKLSRIEYLANGQLIGAVDAGAPEFIWTNALVGVYEVSAKAFDEAGNSATSLPRAIEVVMPSTHIQLLGSQTGDLKVWTNSLGSEGSLISGLMTNFSNLARIIGPSRVGSELRFQMALMDGKPHELALHFIESTNALAQRVMVRSVPDGHLISSQIISNFAGGLLLKMRVRGEFEIVISPLDVGEAALNAIFLDATTVEAPSVALLSPANGFTSVAGETIVLEASSTGVDGSSPRVLFFANDQRLGEIAAPPYRISWTNALAGEYRIIARAQDDFGLGRNSDPVTVTVTLPASSAAFLGTDDITKGDWVDRYGKAAYQIAAIGTNLPPFVTIETPFAVSSVSAYPPLSEVRALSTIDKSARIVAHTFDFDVLTNKIRFKDGQPHLVSIYFLDWNAAGWQSKVRIKDPNGRTLDERMAADFAAGRYYTWAVKGEISIEMEESVWWPALNGIFIDNAPHADSSIALLTPADGTVFKQGDEVLFSAEPNNSGEAADIAQVDFFVSGKNIGSATAPPYGVRWAPPLGENQIHARVINAFGAMNDSAARTIRVDPPMAKPAAIFLGVDDTALGNWRASYGKSGHFIPHLSTDLPPYLTMAFSHAASTIWEWAPTDPRALLWSFGTWRIASAIYADDYFEVNFLANDSRWRKVSFYCLDWDRAGRAQKIEILNGMDRSVLNAALVEDYGAGRYLSWFVRGDVIARFESVTGQPLLSGIFFETLGNMEQWRLDHFNFLSEAEQSNATDEADPDEDGIPNALEYKFGLNPWEPDSPILMNGFLEDGKFYLKMQMNPAAAEVQVEFEISSDLESWASADHLVKVHDKTLGQVVDAIEWQVETQDSSAVFVRIRRNQGTEDASRVGAK